jgi:hypothetical protein
MSRRIDANLFPLSERLWLIKDMRDSIGEDHDKLPDRPSITKLLRKRKADSLLIPAQESPGTK